MLICHNHKILYAKQDTIYEVGGRVHSVAAFIVEVSATPSRERINTALQL
jgi:hypothetical protein